MIDPGTARGATLLPDCLDVAARTWRDRLALTFAGERWSFGALAAAVAAAAPQLSPLTTRGGRLGILSANRPGFVFAVHAARHLGVSVVPLNWRQTAAELAWQIAAAEITVLLVDEERWEVATEAASGLPVAIVPIAALEERPSPQPLAPCAGRGARSGDSAPGIEATGPANERSRVADASPEGAPRPVRGARGWGEGRPLEQGNGSLEHLKGDTPAMIPTHQEHAVLFTSGTTGRPKGVRLSYGNLWFGAVASALHLGHHRDDAWLAALPLFHIGGLSILFRGAITGVPVHLHGQFEPDGVLAAIDNGASLVSLVPTMLNRLIAARGSREWPATLRCVLLGGSAAPSGLISACVERGIPVAPTYGLTEASSQVATLLPEVVASRPGTSGQPLPLTSVRIAMESGLASPNEPGNIEISGPAVFMGYLGKDSTASATPPLSSLAGNPPDGGYGAGPSWFTTGDIGILDEEGYLTVLDRRDDLIVSGGENISPAEIERVLLEHPDVLDAGVFAEADEVWGARPAAAVVWSGDPNDASTALSRYCRERLAAYKAPSRFFTVEILPRSPSGKLLRRELRQRLRFN